MNYGNVDHHLEILIEKGLVSEKRYDGGIRMLRPGHEVVNIQIKRGMRIRIEAQ